MSEDKALTVLTEIRNWIRASSHNSVKMLLEAELPDPKSREAYQLLDGNATIGQVRVACKMSPNGLQALTERWTAIGLMEINEEKKRKRLFNLADFGLLESVGISSIKGKK